MYQQKITAASLTLVCALAVFGAAFAQDDPAPEADDAINQSASGETAADDAVAAESTAGMDDPVLSDGDAAVEDAGDPKPKKAKKDKDADAAAGSADEADIAAADGEPKAKKSKKSDAEGPPADAAAEPKAAREPRERTDFRLSGIVETGFDIIRNAERRTTGNRFINRGELEISARPVRGLRAEIGIEFNQRTSSHTVYEYPSSVGIDVGPYITVDKFLAQYNMPWDGTLRAGIMKKAFGLEERAGVDERYFHSRSRINGELDDSHGFLDHDLTLQYRHDFGRNIWRLAGGISWAVADSLRYLQNYSVQYNPSKDLTFILAAIVRHDYISKELADTVIDRGTLTTFVSSFNARYESPSLNRLSLVSEAEFTFGNTKPRELDYLYQRKDAMRTRYAQDTLIAENATILGIRLQEQLPINIGSKTLNQIIPVVELSAYWEDFESERYETELRFGLTFGFAKNSAFQFRNSFGTRWQMAPDVDAVVERYRYNLQFVMIF